MTSDVKPDDQVRSGPRVILERPKLAELLGDVGAEWAVVEFHLARIYGHLLGARLPNIVVPPLRGLPHDLVAYEIFEEVRSIDARLNLIRQRAAVVIKDPKVLDALEQALKLARKRSTTRITYAHSRWGVVDTEKDALVCLAPHGRDRNRFHRESDFNEAINGIIAAGKAVQEAELMILEHLC